jgi:hypothetical protein
VLGKTGRPRDKTSPADMKDVYLIQTFSTVPSELNLALSCPRKFSHSSNAKKTFFKNQLSFELLKIQIFSREVSRITIIIVSSTFSNGNRKRLYGTTLSTKSLLSPLIGTEAGGQRCNSSRVKY